MADILSRLQWGPVCLKQVTKAGTSNYIPQIVGDVITCPCPWYPFLAPRSWYVLGQTHYSGVTWAFRHISNHWQFDCLFNSLFWLTTKKLSKIHITGPLWGDSTNDDWILLLKGQQCGNSFDSMIYHQFSNIRCTQSPNINGSCLVLQLSLPNPLKPGVKLRMKM